LSYGRMPRRASLSLAWPFAEGKSGQFPGLGPRGLSVP